MTQSINYKQLIWINIWIFDRFFEIRPIPSIIFWHFNNGFPLNEFSSRMRTRVLMHHFSWILANPLPGIIRVRSDDPLFASVRIWLQFLEMGRKFSLSDKSAPFDYSHLPRYPSDASSLNPASFLWLFWKVLQVNCRFKEPVIHDSAGQPEK